MCVSFIKNHAIKNQDTANISIMWHILRCFSTYKMFYVIKIRSGRRKQMICIHHNDLDGRCAAAIVNQAASGKVLFHETDYKDPAPGDETIRGQDVVIVDFSYRPEIMAA